jgi:hypothetical protein
MTPSVRSSFASLLVSVVFAAGALSLSACGGEVEPTGPHPSDPAPGAPQPGSPDPGAPQPGPTAPATPQPSPQGNPLVGDFGHQDPAPASYDGATIHATSTGAALDFQCMHADASALIIDPSGAFEGQGTLTTTGGLLTSYPDAKFTGTVSGDTLTLTVTWPTTLTTSTGTMPYTETYGPATFTKNLVPKRSAGCI